MIKDQPPLDEDEEYVSYDVDSLFANIPVEETSTSAVILITIANRPILIALCVIF